MSVHKVNLGVTGESEVDRTRKLGRVALGGCFLKATRPNISLPLFFLIFPSRAVNGWMAHARY